MIKIIPIEFNEIPIDKVITLNAVDYLFKFRYNSKHDFITVEIWMEESILNVAKIVYGNNIFHVKGENIPVIAPLSELDLEMPNFSNIRVNKDTIGKDVFLFFDDGSN